ncbi:MAG: hypothetical protein NTU53_03940 [Planctomycetota bacterium]|nr:hypothetical protein [Planctomycetota bacterium]
MVAILLLLLGIVIPMFLEARERSNRFCCQNNLRAIGQALLADASENKGRLPATTANTADEPFLIGSARPDNVSAAIFHLIRRYDLSPRLFVCPNTDAVSDTLAGLPLQTRTTFTDPKRNLSYSMQNPYASSTMTDALRRFRSAKPDFVIMADLNPGIRSEDNNVLAVTPTSPTEQMRWGNSNNHSKRGQNVLYADGRVEFADDPFVGVDSDNIYTTRNNTILDYPADPDDNILLPTGD